MKTNKTEKKAKRRVILFFSILLAILMVFIGFQNQDNHSNQSIWKSFFSNTDQDTAMIKMQKKILDSMLQTEKFRTNLDKRKKQLVTNKRNKSPNKKKKTTQKTTVSKSKKTEIIDDFELEDYSEYSEPFSFMSVNQKPVSKGCETIVKEKIRFRCTLEKLQKHIILNFRYPKQAIEEKIEGEVVVSFEVSQKGKITNIEILRPIHKLLDEEAFRLIKILPDMLPAKHNGRPVPVKFSMPVKFKLSY